MCERDVATASTRATESAMSAASQACVFCSIAGGTVPADIVLETPDLVAFLAHRPLFPGHVLLIPRPHVPALADLPADLLGPYFAAAQRKRCSGSNVTEQSAMYEP